MHDDFDGRGGVVDFVGDIRLIDFLCIHHRFKRIGLILKHDRLAQTN